MDTSAQTDALVSLLRDEIFALRNGAHELFVAEPLGQFPRYVQGTVLGSGEVLLEVGSNRFLGDAPLDEAGLSALSERKVRRARPRSSSRRPFASSSE